MAGRRAIALAIGLLAASAAILALGYGIQHAGIDARGSEASEARPITCADGSLWPSDVRQGACNGRGGIAAN